MYYVSRSDLPLYVRHKLTTNAQDIYVDEFNSSYRQFGQSFSSNERKNSKLLAHKVAWATMKYRCRQSHIKSLIAI